MVKKIAHKTCLRIMGVLLKVSFWTQKVYTMTSKTTRIEYITIKRLKDAGEDNVLSKTIGPGDEISKRIETEDPKPYRVEAESPRDKVSDGRNPLSPTGPSYRSPLNPGPRMPKTSPQSGLPVPRSGVLSDRTVRLPGLIPRNGFKN